MSFGDVSWGDLCWGAGVVIADNPVQQTPSGPRVLTVDLSPRSSGVEVSRRDLIVSVTERSIKA